MAHVFVADLDGLELDAGDRHHLERVLRLRPGEALTVSDGRGTVLPCRFVAGGGVEPAGERRRHPPAAPALTVGFALVKGDRPEWIVQKLTECGVDRIVPFAAARSVVRWDAAKGEKALERLRRVSREAAMQSHQPYLPEVTALRSYAELVTESPASVAVADLEGEAPSLARPTILVGPEGGWAPEERAAAPARVRFGPSVLRAETAAVAAGVLLTALRAGVVTAVNRKASARSAVE